MSSAMVLHDDRDTIIAGLREQLRQAREELAQERAKGSSAEEGVAELRTALTPLYRGLQKIFDETEGMVTMQSSPARASLVWEDWKAKLSGSAAKAIDTLLLHGTMSADQLRIHLGCATRTCYNIIGELNRAKLINKNNGKISLKEL